MNADDVAALVDKLIELKDDPDTANALLDLVIEQADAETEDNKDGEALKQVSDAFADYLGPIGKGK